MLSSAFAQSSLPHYQIAVDHQHRRNLSLLSRACVAHTDCCLLNPAVTGPQRRKLRLIVHKRRVDICASAQTEHAETAVQHNGFEWATNVSRHGNVYFAIDETSQACTASMSSSSGDPTVALFFAASSYSVEFDRIIPVLRSKVPSLQHIIGCTVCFPGLFACCCGLHMQYGQHRLMHASRCMSMAFIHMHLCEHAKKLQGFGVIGDSAEGPQEVEGEPALSLTLGVLPGVSTFTHITATTASLDLRTHSVRAMQSCMHVHTCLPEPHLHIGE